MNRSHIALLVLGLVTLAALVQMASAWPDLPEQIPTHYSGGGPDSWSDKSGFLWIWTATLLGTALFMAGIGWLLGRLNPRWINLPHAATWLASEYREATLLDLRTRIWWLGALTILLFLDLQVQMFAVARGEAEDLTHFGLSMAIYLLATLAWVVLLYIRYGRKPNTASAA